MAPKFHASSCDIATAAEIPTPHSVMYMTLERPSVGARLGFTMMSNGEHGAVLVTRVDPGPAAGKLSVGDRIIAINDVTARGAGHTLQQLAALDLVVLMVERSPACCNMAAALDEPKVVRT